MLAGSAFLEGLLRGRRRANVGVGEAGPAALDSRADPGPRDTVKSTSRAAAQGEQATPIPETRVEAEVAS